MANWCKNDIRIDGDGLEAVVDKINSVLLRQGDEWALDFEHWGVKREWLLLPERPALVNGVCEFWGDCKWRCPVDGLEAISRDMPHIRISVCYSVEGLWDAGKLHIANGETRQTKHWRGYFASAEVGDPIHHWLIWSKEDAVLDAIRDAGLAVYGEEQKHEVTVRDMEAVESLVDSRFPETKVCATPYTLEEEVYVGSVETISEHPAFPRCEHLKDLVAIAERDIILTQEEIIGARDELLAAETAHKEAIKDGRWMPRVYEIEFERYRRYFGNLALGQRPEFHPTGREIRLLLPHCNNDQRKQELQHALTTPRWSKAWPPWEIREQERKKDEARRMEDSKRLMIPKTLLGQLVPDPDGFQERLRELEHQQSLEAFDAFLNKTT